MSTAIEVRVAGRGTVKDGTATQDDNTKATCELCGAEVDVVASTSKDGGSFACKRCLRERLEAMTVGTYLLSDKSSEGLPWGKISG